MFYNYSNTLAWTFISIGARHAPRFWTSRCACKRKREREMNKLCPRHSCQWSSSLNRLYEQHKKRSQMTWEWKTWMTTCWWWERGDISLVEWNQCLINCHLSWVFYIYRPCPSRQLNSIHAIITAIVGKTQSYTRQTASQRERERTTTAGQPAIRESRSTNQLIGVFLKAILFRFTI